MRSGWSADDVVPIYGDGDDGERGHEHGHVWNSFHNSTKNRIFYKFF